MRVHRIFNPGISGGCIATKVMMFSGYDHKIYLDDVDSDEVLDRL